MEPPYGTATGGRIVRAGLSWGAVTSAAAVLLATLVSLSGRYGYHRDELYFRLLPPAWGYLDQPGFTPWLARATLQLGDQPAWLRLPAALLASLSVIVIGLVVAEVGGSVLAQTLAAWGYAFGTMTLSFGHVLLTASVDLVVWPLVVLFVLRAILRGQSRWWWLAGLVIGLSTYNKWLVTLLLAALVGGLLICGPRRILVSRPVLGAGLLAAVVAAPNVLWQANRGWPQLAMGRALSEANGAEVRFTTVPMLFVLVGPLVFAFVVAGVVRLMRHPPWRPMRFLAAALAIVVALTVVGGSQFYYPYGLLAVTYALGCVPVATWADRSARRRWAVLAVLALHVATNAVISLPVLPLPVLARTFIPSVNAGVSDQVGWPRYAQQIDAVVDEAARSDPAVVVLTSNYGEAGAIARFGHRPEARVFSGHNALWEQGPPPPRTGTVVVVGGQLGTVSREFSDCRIVTRLSNGVGLDNEEEGEPVAICRGPRSDWPELWPRLRHLS